LLFEKNGFIYLGLNWVIKKIYIWAIHNMYNNISYIKLENLFCNIDFVFDKEILWW